MAVGEFFVKIHKKINLMVALLIFVWFNIRYEIKHRRNHQRARRSICFSSKARFNPSAYQQLAYPQVGRSASGAT